MSTVQDICESGGGGYYYLITFFQAYIFMWLRSVQFFFLIYLFYLFYFWLCWVFFAAHGLSLIAASGG